jgi:hypothetical protein
MNAYLRDNYGDATVASGAGAQFFAIVPSCGSLLRSYPKSLQSLAIML